VSATAAPAFFTKSLLDRACTHLSLVIAMQL